MGTKVKGFFKGLKNISNIFDEGQDEPEIQIGMPTDVKHVAHIGVDGPANESPSWMNKFDGGQSQSGPLDMASSTDIRKGTNNHMVSRSEEITRDLPDKPKPSRHRRRSMDNSEDLDSQQKKHTRRRHRIRRFQDQKGDESKLPDIPKKSRRKKSKEDDGSTKSRDSESSNNEPKLDP